MSTTLKPELSEKNPYWIERHRYYELKHFCLQYKGWRQAYAALDGYVKPGDIWTSMVTTNSINNPTVKAAMKKAYYKDRIEMLERMAKQTDPVIGECVLRGVVDGISYDVLKTKMNVPCCKDVYYELYRKFFWMLDKERE